MKRLNDVVVTRLLKYMGEKDLTQYKLSQLSTVPLSTIKHIIQRKTKGIELKTIILLADGLGITASEFLDEPSFLADNLDLE